ncbi:hypothetical protein TKK_0009871 [Trichogramma kaykai]
MSTPGQQQPAVATIEQFKLKLTIWCEVISTYEGGTRLLSYYVQQCDAFCAALATDNAGVIEALFSFLKSKLKGEALDLIIANKPTDWTACKQLLISRFSDPSSEDLLFNRLSTRYQQMNQSYEKYADEIKKRLNKTKEHVVLNSKVQLEIETKTKFYDNVAKNTFINE